jgi:hypothetical protein
MPDISEKFVVLTITKDETRVWATGTSPGNIPTKVHSPTAHHFHNDPKRRWSGDGPGVPRYYEEIVSAIGGASEILLIGHGHGKASSMLHFNQYLERKYPNLAKKIVDALDTNLLAMSEPEVLAMARGWFEDHPR